MKTVLLAVISVLMLLSGNTHAETQMPSLGNNASNYEVTIFSDYFCPACTWMEPRIQTVIPSLAEKARIVFVDIPGHPPLSTEYAEVFVSVWLAGNDIQSLLKAREVLFQASSQALVKKEPPPSGAVLTAKLISMGIAVKGDPAAVRDVFLNQYSPVIIKENITQTPTVIILNKKTGKKEIFNGEDRMYDAFKGIMTEGDKK